jgi:hypothetical protein
VQIGRRELGPDDRQRHRAVLPGQLGPVEILEDRNGRATHVQPILVLARVRARVPDDAIGLHERTRAECLGWHTPEAEG